MSFLKNKKDKALESGKKVLGFEHAKEGFDFIQTMVNFLKLTFKKTRVANGTENTESFSQMCERLGVSEDQLKINYKHLSLQFYLIFLCWALAVIFWGMALMSGNLWSSIPFSAFTLLCAALLFKSSYRSFQLACREFVSINYWYKKKEYWFPVFDLPFIKLKRKKIARPNRKIDEIVEDEHEQ